MALKPDQSIIVAALVAAGVYGIFQHNAPNLSDVRASAPGGAASMNTHNSVKTAIYTSAALVIGVGILAKDPTVYILGGLVTAVEGWKYYEANSKDAATGNVVAPGSSMSGQPAPTLNQ
jgi:hypothetical protein